MTGKGQRRQTLLIDDDSQFLLQFSDQTFFRALSGLDLAARKLPKTGHRFAFRTLGDEHTSVRIDERTGGDQDKIHTHRPDLNLGTAGKGRFKPPTFIPANGAMVNKHLLYSRRCDGFKRSWPIRVPPRRRCRALLAVDYARFLGERGTGTGRRKTCRAFWTIPAARRRRLLPATQWSAPRFLAWRQAAFRSPPVPDRLRCCRSGADRSGSSRRQNRDCRTTPRCARKSPHQKSNSATIIATADGKMRGCLNAMPRGRAG